MRYAILDDAKAGFAQLHEGGNGWGSDNYTTSVATGDVDGDGLDEVVIGRRSNVNMRYEILDDAKAGFAQIHEGGNGWGSGNFTRSVAAGDLDNDGIDEVVIGRETSVNMRYEILDDAGAGFAQIHSGGSGWGSGNYATAVTAGPVRRNRLDLHFGNQDTGSFASTNAEELKPTWRNVDCCDSFEVPSTQTQMLVTVCCFTPRAGQPSVLASAGNVRRHAGHPPADGEPAGLRADGRRRVVRALERRRHHDHRGVHHDGHHCEPPGLDADRGRIDARGCAPHHADRPGAKHRFLRTGSQRGSALTRHALALHGHGAGRNLATDPATRRSGQLQHVRR